MLKPNLPNDSEHIAIAGRTGSGKTVGALDMLSRRNFNNMAHIIIDHKGDDNIAQLPADKLKVNPVFLPQRGLHVVKAGMKSTDRQDIEDLLHRVFDKGNIGIYVDEGHLLGPSDMLRTILVAGRSKKVPLMWTSQRASWIDSFIWSQSTFYRVFKLQIKADTKRFEENFPIKWQEPAPFHSWYYDGKQGKVFYLAPSPPIENTIAALTYKLKSSFKSI